jgi:hypothetical protein
MALTFSSKAAGDVTMLDAHVKQVFDIIGREPGSRGVLRGADIGAALASLNQAIEAAERARESAQEDDDDGKPVVTLKVRAQPFMELLTKSAKAGADVTWGI